MSMEITMRILFITLEFSAATFSGNGVYAQDQVRHLSSLGNRVLVVSAKPESHQRPPDHQGAYQLIEIPVSSWGRLDIESPWIEFKSKINAMMIQAVANFNPDVVIGVDWSSFPVYQKLKTGFRHSNPPFVFASYQIYTRTSPEGDPSLFLKKAETDCVSEAAVAIVLSKTDQQFVLEHLSGDRRVSPIVLFPNIREDVLSIPLLNQKSIANGMLEDASENHSSQTIEERQTCKFKPYFSCVVRLSPEKEPHRFVELVIEMEKRGFLKEFQLQPLMIGVTTTPYAQKLKQRLLDAVPDSLVIDRFLGPLEMAKLFSQTRLNVHPCLYDPYGMTIVEAAAQEVPSVVHKEDNIGAKDFLRADRFEIFEMDFDVPAAKLAEHIADLFRDDEKLQNVGKNASNRARQYTAKQNAEKLQNILTQVVQRNGAQHS